MAKALKYHLQLRTKEDAEGGESQLGEVNQEHFNSLRHASLNQQSNVPLAGLWLQLPLQKQSQHIIS